MSLFEGIRGHGRSRRQSLATRAFTLVEVLMMGSLISVFIGLVYYFIAGSFTLVNRSSDYSLLLHRVNLLVEYLKADLSGAGNVYSVSKGVVTLEKPAFSLDRSQNVFTIERVLGADERGQAKFHEITYESHPSRDRIVRVTRTDKTLGKQNVIDFSFVPRGVKLNVYPSGEEKGAFVIALDALDMTMNVEIFSSYLGR
jgi:hypothetical protein